MYSVHIAQLTLSVLTIVCYYNSLMGGGGGVGEKRGCKAIFFWDVFHRTKS